MSWFVSYIHTLTKCEFSTPFTKRNLGILAYFADENPERVWAQAIHNHIFGDYLDSTKPLIMAKEQIWFFLIKSWIRLKKFKNYT